MLPTAIVILIQELKGNIRVFCRVRPLLPDERSSPEGNFISYPSSVESLGRGIDLVQNGILVMDNIQAVQIISIMMHCPLALLLQFDIE